MRWLRNYKLFKESKSNEYNGKNLVSEICTAMVLLNNEFLDNILDRGLKARYSEDSGIFLTDLKNLLIAKNRLCLGKFEGERCIDDNEIGKTSGIFENTDFSIEKDWDKLSNARVCARAIIDKILPTEKMTPEIIRKVYWLGPNKDKEHNEDLVIELNDDRQMSIVLNKSLSTQKSASFNSFADDLIGENTEKLFSETYMKHWNKLTQEWVKTIYENANKDIQRHIEKFIQPERIETIGYFEYFDVKHGDQNFKHLGELIPQFDKNILKLSDLMSEIWKNIDECFMDPERVKKEWTETKIVLLNSKILENLFTSSIKTEFPEDIQLTEDNNLKIAGGTVKMKLFKAAVEKLGCTERSVWYLNNNGSILSLVPARSFFRNNYDDMELKFDYHVKFEVSEEEDMNDFPMKIVIEIEEEKLIDLLVSIKFTGGEMSGKLGAKYKFNLADNFNQIVSKRSEQ
jgi:hypothetical protein